MRTDYSIKVTKHYVSRFRKRIARSKRIEYFANEAYICGDAPEGVDDTRLRTFLLDKENLHGNECVLKVYKGFVHVFDSLTNVAVTVYKVPKLKSMCE